MPARCGVPIEAVVLGAGVAGLGAARALWKRGVFPLVLEARDRIGGRICTARDPRVEVPLELGAEFLHGIPSKLFPGMRIRRWDAPSADGPHFILRAGRLAPADRKFGKAMSLMAKAGERDEPFADFLERE